MVTTKLIVASIFIVFCVSTAKADDRWPFVPPSMSFMASTVLLDQGKMFACIETYTDYPDPQEFRNGMMKASQNDNGVLFLYRRCPKTPVVCVKRFAGEVNMVTVTSHFGLAAETVPGIPSCRDGSLLHLDSNGELRLDPYPDSSIQQPLLCNDGTYSPTCVVGQASYKGCCSGHEGKRR